MAASWYLAMVFAPPHLRAPVRIAPPSRSQEIAAPIAGGAATDRAVAALSLPPDMDAKLASIDQEFLQHTEFMLTNGYSNAVQSRFRTTATDASCDFNEYLFLAQHGRSVCARSYRRPWRVRDHSVRPQIQAFRARGRKRRRLLHRVRESSGAGDDSRASACGTDERHAVRSTELVVRCLCNPGVQPARTVRPLRYQADLRGLVFP